MNKLFLSVLLAGSLAYGCSSDKSSNTGGNAGSTSNGGSDNGGSDNGGSTATGGSDAGMSGGAGGTSGTGGASGQTGVPPTNGVCPRRSSKHADGLCYCQPATLTMCTDACANFQTDPDHCGDCDTACGDTQTCNAGQCSMPPSAAVPAATGCGSIYLAVAGGTLYWTDTMHGTVKSLAAGSTTPTTLADTQMAPKEIRVSGTSVYWLNSGDNSIMKAPAAGGAAAAAVVTSQTAIGGFTVSADGNTLYFSTEMKINTTSTTPGGAVTEYGHEDTGIPEGVAVEGALVGYSTNNNNDIDIMQGTPAVCASDDSTTATNMNCKRAGRSQGALNYNDVQILNGTIYWANQASILSSSATNPSGANDIIANGNPDASTIAAFAISNDTVFFADDKGYVTKAPLMVGATTTPLARAQLGVTSVAADADHVYWAPSDCSIMTLPAN